MKRLTPATLTLLMFVVVGGLVVAYIAKGLFAVEAKPEIARKNIPMAVGDVLPGTVLTENHIGLGPILVSELRPDMLINNRVIVGRVVKETLKAATPIRSAQLYEPGTRPPLVVEDGMRAITIDTNGASAIVDGLIRPGQYCDIHMTISDYTSDDSRHNPGLTLTLMKGVRILAINRYTQQGTVSRDANSVTLELTPSQANIILLAQNKGRLNLTYNPAGKGTGGIAVNDADRVLLDEILGIKRRQPAAAPFTSQIYRRSARQELQFTNQNGLPLIRDVTPQGLAPVVPIPNDNSGSAPAVVDPPAQDIQPEPAPSV